MLNGKRSDERRFYFRAIDVESLIRIAYKVERYQIDSRSAPMSPADYEVDATIPEGISRDQIPLMMQKLLAERFGLKIHPDTRAIPVYALIVGPTQPKLRRSVTAIGPDGLPITNPAVSYSISTPPWGLELKGATVSVFAGSLRPYVGRPVLDTTGIEGKYDFALHFDPSLSATENDDSARDPARGSIFSVVRDLGFRLEKRDVPMTVIVIDHVEKAPTPN
jgi:uncharacterized protein (TIGR03435 family)